jgi:hypothetical protein
MNRRKALLGLVAGSAATTQIVRADDDDDDDRGGSRNGGGSLTAFILNSGGAVIGTFEIYRFRAINNQLHAVGTVTATNGLRTVVSSLAVPVTASAVAQQAGLVQQQQASCPVLHLAIGPINLNLLGLQIVTQPIVVDIVAVPGPGNLLGNLLCTIAGLLDPGGALPRLLNQLIGLLNQLLRSL